MVSGGEGMVSGGGAVAVTPARVGALPLLVLPPELVLVLELVLV
jgi:hypothetical protein